MKNRPLVIILAGHLIAIAVMLVVLATDHGRHHDMRIPALVTIAIMVLSMPFMALRWRQVQRNLIARRQHATAPRAGR
jgi:hypothetical protein